jgi:2'-5' RNA ligase
MGEEKNMGSKAVDVVLLPDEAMTEAAIEANAELVEKFGRKIVLSKKDCLPHISLAMGCIDDGDIADVERILKDIAGQYSVRDLKVVDVKFSTNAVGEKVSVFEVRKTSQLQALHEAVMEKLESYLRADVTGDMVYGDEVAESALLWIRNYREKSSFASFFPHITIGYGEIESRSFPIQFVALRLALCHLGNHCTCRKVLASVEL